MNLPSDLAAAERHYAEGRHGEAMPLLETHCARHPNDRRGRYLLAAVRLAAGDPSGAERTIRPLLATAIAPVQHVAGLIALDRGDEAEAERRLRRALVCGPGHPGAWQALAGIRTTGRAAVALAAAAAVVDPGDVEGWIRLRAAIAVAGDPAGSERDRRLLAEAADRASETLPNFSAAARALLPDWRRGAVDAATLGDREDAIVRWLIQLTAQSRDPGAQSGLDRHLRRLALWHPGVRAAWLGLLLIHGRDTSPRDRSLLRAARRVVAFGGAYREAARPDRPFEACVEAKAVQSMSSDLSAGVIGHAAGLQALSDTLGAPVSLRWQNGERLVRLRGREIRYAPSSPPVVGFLARIFLFEPGLWRWMAGFGRDDVLLDIGANIGIYSIAAAGLFGVRVVALEPYGPNLRALRRNIALNRLEDRILVLPIAAIDSERTGRLYHKGGDAGAAAQYFSAGVDVGADADQPFDQVEGVPVDVLVERGRIPFPTRIKIDVDGNERAVIEGMTRILADPRLHSVRLEVRWRVPEGRAVVERVRSFGFAARVDDDAKNLLFTRPES